MKTMDSKLIASFANLNHLNHLKIEPNKVTPNHQQHSPQLPASLGTEATQPGDDAGVLAFQGQGYGSTTGQPMVV